MPWYLLTTIYTLRTYFSSWQMYSWSLPTVYKVFLCLPSLNSNWWFLLVLSVTECLSSGTSAVIVMKKIPVGISKIHPYSLHRTTASISDQDTKISSLNMERAWDDNCIKKFVDACLKLKILKKNRHGFVSAFATQKFHTFSKSILPSMLYPELNTSPITTFQKFFNFFFEFRVNFYLAWGSSLCKDKCLWGKLSEL